MPSPMHRTRFSFAGAPLVLAALIVASAAAQTARDIRGTAAVEPLQDEPPAKIVVDLPLPAALSRGRVVISYRTENLHIAPVFGPAALAVSPRVGHRYVSVDDAAWVWAGLSSEPITLNGLPPGPHKVLLQLENANHQVLDHGVATFTVPEPPVRAAAERAMGEAAPAQPVQAEPPAKISIESPLAEPLSRGVVFARYHTENLQILPVFGPSAAAITPRIGHIHVTVDDAPWHWADASGGPVILLGLTPGRHKILIELVNANHQVIDQGTLQVTVPAAKPHSGAH